MEEKEGGKYILVVCGASVRRIMVGRALIGTAAVLALSRRRQGCRCRRIAVVVAGGALA